MRIKIDASTSLSPNFNPKSGYVLYIIRREILKAVLNNRKHLYGRMMDFGCGSKPYQALFEVTEYIGVDYAGEGHSHDNENIDIYYDGKTLPFTDNHFDSIFSSEVFEHIFNLEEIILELHRVLKPNGKMLISCPFVWNEHEVPIDYARYTQFALRHLFEKNGFEVIVMEKTGNFWLTLVQLFQLWIPVPHLLGFGRLIRSPINIIGLILNKIFPKRMDLYLNNVVVVRKCKKIKEFNK